jgi:hypothetical protein
MSTARVAAPVATLAGLALLAACAAAPVREEKEPFPGTAPVARDAAGAGAHAAAAPQPSPEPPSPSTQAAHIQRPDQCEQIARAAQASSRDRAWQLLRACVERGNFTLIRRLLDGGWDRDLQTRSDAAGLIARVVAARGGDVYGDLNLLRQKRVPIFGLAPAAGHPDLYQGRLVMLRARVDDVKAEKGKATVRLAEFALSGQLKDVAGSERYVTRRRAASGSQWSQSPISGSARRRWQGESEKSEGWEKVQRTENTPQETGLQALARLPALDPFFEPGRQFVVLARFDGVRQMPGEGEEGEADTMPVLSIILYVEPSPVIVE